MGTISFFSRNLEGKPGNLSAQWNKSWKRARKRVRRWLLIAEAAEFIQSTGGFAARQIKENPGRVRFMHPAKQLLAPRDHFQGHPIMKLVISQFKHSSCPA
jgi:hypothetical protein